MKIRSTTLLATILLPAFVAGCRDAPPESNDSPLPAREARVATESPLHEPLAVNHLLLITIDTLRADVLGFAGNSRVATPVLDRLAATGLVFDNARGHNVVTLPSHANILTGLFPYQHGIRDNLGFVLPERFPTAATLLQEAGFATGAVVGAYPLDARFGLDRGFDHYDDELPEGTQPTQIAPVERRGDEVVTRALAWWRRNVDRQRFLWIHLFDPHAPYEPPDPFASRYADAPYLGEVAAVDSFLAPLLEPFLSGQESSTLIAFTADHGEALGDHGELTHGLFAYEATLKVPLVLWASGLPAGRNKAPVRHVDLLPTLLDAVGVKGPGHLPGRSLLSPGEEAEEPDSYFEALTATLDRGWAPLRGTIHRGFKLISLPLPELYDLAADPQEGNNVFASDRGRADALARRLPAESRWPPDRGPVSAEDEASMRGLGYLGGRAASKQTFSAGDDPKNLVEYDRQMHQVVDLYQRRRLAEAAAAAQAIITKRPDMGVAYYYLAQTLLEDARLPEAVAVMEEANRRGVATPALIRQLGMSLTEVGRGEQAVALLREAAQTGDPDALNAFGLVLSEIGRQPEARKVLQQVFDRDARNALAHQHLALVALRLQEWETARDEARQALVLSEGLTDAWSYLGSALYSLGAPREALAAWQRAVARGPHNFDALYNIALVAIELGENTQAKEALRQFIGSAPPGRYGPDIENARSRLRQLED